MNLHSDNQDNKKPVHSSNFISPRKARNKRKFNSRNNLSEENFDFAQKRKKKVIGNKSRNVKLLGNKTIKIDWFSKLARPLTFKTFKKFILKKEKEIFKNSRRCQFLRKLVQTKTFNYIVVLIIILSIFGDNLRRIFLPKKYDLIVDILIIILAIIFILEIISNILNKKMLYIFSLYFILDSLATMSMIFDITIFSENVFAGLEK